MPTTGGRAAGERRVADRQSAQVIGRRYLSVKPVATLPMLSSAVIDSVSVPLANRRCGEPMLSTKCEARPERPRRSP